jgi:hypothetical protein
MSRPTAKKIAAEQEAPEVLVKADAPVEYASFCLEIKPHLTARKFATGHVVNQGVYSTESATESLVSLIEYHKQADLLIDTGTRAMIQRGDEKASVFVYTVGPHLTYVVCDKAVMDELMDDSTPLGSGSNPDGTIIGSHAALFVLANELKNAASAAGRIAPIISFVTD